MAEEKQVRDTYCPMHEDNVKEINRQKGMWVMLLLCLISLLAFAGYINTTVNRIEVSIESHMIHGEVSSKAISQTLAELKSASIANTSLIRDMDRRLFHLENKWGSYDTEDR